MKQVKASVISNDKITSSFYQMWLEAPSIVSEAKPGQYVMIRCGSGTILPRPFSIHKVNESRLAILFTVVGSGTTWLSQRKVDDTISLFGPLGNGYTIYPESRNLLLVGGGVGVSPLHFLADEAVEKRKVVTFAMGAVSSMHLLPTIPSEKGLLSGGILPFGITIYKSTDDGSEGYPGLVTQLTLEKDLIKKADQVFACGPLPMYRSMAQMPALKNKPVQVSLEVRMGCGRGVCYGCTIKTKTGLKKVCEDGPVFNLDEIIWDELSPV